MNRLDNALYFHNTAIDLRARRQELLASNIANADTPNYKARDIDFGSALKGALHGGMGQALAMAATSKGHMAGTGSVGDANVMYRTEEQSSVDGNTVNMDVERAAFTENAAHYEASLTFINGLLKSMQTAITGQ